MLPQEGIFASPLLYGSIGLGALLGFGSWLVAARKSTSAVLSFPQRLTLSGLLLGILLAWWPASKLAPQWQNKPGPRRGNLAFTQTTGDRVKVTPPIAASFAVAEIRSINNREVLMVLPPARMEWKLDGRTHAVAIAFGIEPRAYEEGTTNGAALIIELVEGAGKREIYNRLLNPVHEPADRGMQQTTVTLPSYKPGAHLLLRSDPGEFGDTAWDWVYLAEFRFMADAKVPDNMTW